MWQQLSFDQAVSFSESAIRSNQADCPPEKIDSPQWGHQVKRVYEAMKHGRYMTKAEIAFQAGCSEHGVSARLSDLKKQGILCEKRKARESNYYEYRFLNTFSE